MTADSSRPLPEELVEVAARALYETDRDIDVLPGWPTLDQGSREFYFDRARAVLSAVLALTDTNGDRMVMLRDELERVHLNVMQDGELIDLLADPPAFRLKGVDPT